MKIFLFLIFYCLYFTALCQNTFSLAVGYQYNKGNIININILHTHKIPKKLSINIDNFLGINYNINQFNLTNLFEFTGKNYSKDSTIYGFFNYTHESNTENFLYTRHSLILGPGINITKLINFSYGIVNEYNYYSTLQYFIIRHSLRTRFKYTNKLLDTYFSLTWQPGLIDPKVFIIKLQYKLDLKINTIYAISLIYNGFFENYITRKQHILMLGITITK